MTTENDPTLMPELTQTQWYAADIAARAALLLYYDAELAERILRRLLDERRLVQDAASSTAAEHQSTATLAMAAAQTLGATNMLLAQAPTPQAQDYIVTELVTAQVIANKPPDLMGAVAMAKTIQQLTFVPRIYPAPV